MDSPPRGFSQAGRELFLQNSASGMRAGELVEELVIFYGCVYR
eukprot:SAG22_NODE_234_length_14360_cov_13.245915_6_plen_43_part_00